MNQKLYRVCLRGWLGLMFFLPMDLLSATVLESSEPQRAVQPAAKPQMIYVEDFYLNVTPSEDEKEGPLRSFLHRRKGDSDDSGDLTRSIASRLSKILIEEMNNQGLLSTRVAPGEECIPGSWLLQGEFLDSNKDGVLQRASIGSRVKNAPMHVMVMVSEVKSGALEPFLIFDPSAASGKRPGSILASVLMKNPYVIAAKFVLSRQASDREIKTLASEIAKELAQYMKEKKLI